MRRHAHTEEAAFRRFVESSGPSLRRALAGHLAPDDLEDAVAEAHAYAWDKWDRVRTMRSPEAYLFRVAQSRSCRRRQGMMPAVPVADPGVDPDLINAMRQLTDRQRTVVWLVVACRWTYQDVADALSISASAVGSHRERAMETLRAALSETEDA